VKTDSIVIDALYVDIESIIKKTILDLSEKYYEKIPANVFVGKVVGCFIDTAIKTAKFGELPQHDLKEIVLSSIEKAYGK
jgi:hypothetical protein